MLRILYHTLYKMCYIMYYITWHKIFHSFANQVLRLVRMVLTRTAMKNCCLLGLAIVLLFSSVSRETLVVSASSLVTVSYPYGVIVPTPANVSNGRVTANVKFSNFKFQRSFDLFTARANYRKFADNKIVMKNIHIPMSIQSGRPQYSNYIRWNGKAYYRTDSSTPKYSSGTATVVFPTPDGDSTTNISFESNSSFVFDFGEKGYSADLFRSGYFSTLDFGARINTGSGYYVASDGSVLPFNAPGAYLYFWVNYTLEAKFIPDQTDVISSIDNITSTIVDSTSTISAGLSLVHQDIKDQTNVIHQDIKDQTNVIHQDIKDQTNVIHQDIKDQTNVIHQDIKDQTNKIHQDIKDQTNSITQNNNQNTQKILDQNSQFRQEDRQEAQSVGQIAKEFLDTNTEKVKSNFNILWEPIAFTQRMISVFSGGTKSSIYACRYDGVVGFTYNEHTGCLDPVIDIGPRARYGRASGGTTITFPAYTLPVLNLKLWDAYTFDVATVKDAFPALFDTIYVFSGILCLYWFLGFLSQKFEEVFKE